jgi:hypothetical protein
LIQTWPCAYSRASLQIARVEFIERLDLLDPKVSKLRTMATGTSSSGAAVAPAATSSSTNTRLGDALAKLRRKVTGVLTCVNSITNEPWFKYAVFAYDSIFSRFNFLFLSYFFQVSPIINLGCGCRGRIVHFGAFATPRIAVV